MNHYRTIYRAVAWLFIVALLHNCGYAQETGIDTDFKSATIDRLNALMTENYVFPDVAEKTAAHLTKKLNAGEFDEFNTTASFADALTKAVQSINEDKHMRIRPTPPRESPDNSPERLVEDHLHRLNASRQNMAGFKAVKRLDGNIGYLDLRGFAGVAVGGPVADQYMDLMSNTDAVIIDLRKNGGGSPAMVQYLCSYFFDKKVHLNSLYWRRGDRTEEFWTLEEVGGKKMPDVPLFVLTSSYTFSGAEEFSYNMQTQKRATLVGETTGGGANPGGGFMINEKLMVFIPTGRAINPITGINWEGTGVTPEVKTNAEEALDKAIELATEAAEAYREERQQKDKMMLDGLFSSLSELGKAKSEAQVLEQVAACVHAELLTENDINQLGYHLMEGQASPDGALVIFKANTKLYPNSANVHDSYAEGLLRVGRKEEAIKYYEKAVKLAEKTQASNLELFRENLQRAQESE